MRDPENITEISLLHPDMMGFIFYPPSPRNAIGISKETIKSIPEDVTPVGVFVNTPMESIVAILRDLGITHVQLHGNESPQDCKMLKKLGFTVIKAFRIPTSADKSIFDKLQLYEDAIDYFLFDTAGFAPGGNGNKFDWEILRVYSSPIPFILSGGISEADASNLQNGLPEKCVGIDLNSRFEDSPVMKNVFKINEFIKQIMQ